jgi:citrate lyase beta subunit
MTIAEQDSRGAFVVDGEMADAMTVRVARRVLATARALQAAGRINSR